MHQVLYRFDYFGKAIAIYSYGVALLIAALCFVWITSRLSHHRAIPQIDTLYVSLLGLCGALLGALLFDLLLHFRNFKTSHYQAGLVFYGAIFGGPLLVVYYLKRFKLNIASYLDIAAVAIPFSHSIGRLGCVLGGCCYGKPAGSWPGLIYRDPKTPAFLLSRAFIPLHPVAFYEAVGLVTIGIGLYFALRYKRLKNKLFSMYILLYAFLRFILEFLRGDRAREFFGYLSTSQWIALFSAIGALIYLYKQALNQKKNGFARSRTQ